MLGSIGSERMLIFPLSFGGQGKAWLSPSEDGERSSDAADNLRRENRTKSRKNKATRPLLSKAQL